MAQRLLERCATTNTRLLGSFNVPIRCWLDFFTYASFIDRDGKYQLNMLSRSSFAPLARSMRPMLQEEAYHLLTGNTGLMRVVKAGRIPLSTIQKYFYKWISTAYDLFGQDESSSAHWVYLWGLKGRYDEHVYEDPADMGKLNELSRSLFRKEVGAIVDALNRQIPEEQPKLRLPDPKFNRKHWRVCRGDLQRGGRTALCGRVREASGRGRAYGCRRRVCDRHRKREGLDYRPQTEEVVSVASSIPPDPTHRPGPSRRWDGPASGRFPAESGRRTGDNRSPGRRPRIS